MANIFSSLSQQKQRIQSLETEIDGYKKSIQKEQEQNEKLTLILNKTEVDIATVKKLQNICNSKHDALKTEYAAYTRMLHETEQALNRANTVSEIDKQFIRCIGVYGLFHVERMSGGYAVFSISCEFFLSVEIYAMVYKIHAKYLWLIYVLTQWDSFSSCISS